MRSAISRFALAALLTSGPFRLAIAEGNGPEVTPRDERTTALIEALRTEEAKFRDIDYALRITTRRVDPSAPDGPGEITSSETRRVVLQGDRVFFRGESTIKLFGNERHDRQTSAFGGDLAYDEEHKEYTTLEGERSEQHGVQAFDGQWTRGFSRWVRADKPE